MEHRRGRDAESVEIKYALGLERSHERTSLQGTLLGPEGSGVYARTFRPVERQAARTTESRWTTRQHSTNVSG